MKAPYDQLVRILAKAGVGLVFDAGANVGQYASKLRRHGYGGRVVSFEPAPASRAALSAALAGDGGWELAAEAALGAWRGRLDLKVYGGSDMNSFHEYEPSLRRSLFSDEPVLESVPVEVHRLDEIAERYIKGEAGLALKIDTQGHEAAVLAGAERLLPRLAVIQLEMSLRPVYDGEADFLALTRLLGEKGFVPHHFFPVYFHERTARLYQMDGVFVRGDLSRAWL